MNHFVDFDNFPVIQGNVFGGTQFQHLLCSHQTFLSLSTGLTVYGPGGGV